MLTLPNQSLRWRQSSHSHRRGSLVDPAGSKEPLGFHLLRLLASSLTQRVRRAAAAGPWTSIAVGVQVNTDHDCKLYPAAAASPPTYLSFRRRRRVVSPALRSCCALGPQQHEQLACSDSYVD